MIGRYLAEITGGDEITAEWDAITREALLAIFSPLPRSEA